MHPAGVHGNQLGRIRHPVRRARPSRHDPMTCTRPSPNTPTDARTSSTSSRRRRRRRSLPGSCAPGTNGDARRHQRRRGRRIGARRDRRLCPRPAVGRARHDDVIERARRFEATIGPSDMDRPVSPIPADGNPGSRTGSSRGDLRTLEIVDEPPHERPPSNDANSAIAGWKGFWVLRYTTVTEPFGRTSGIMPDPVAWSAVRTGALQFRPPSRDVDARTTSSGPPKCRPSSSQSA